MSTSAAARAVKQAVRYLRRHGLDGPRPVNYLEAMMSDRDAAIEALQATLERAADHDLAPATRLARMLDARETADAIAAAVLRRAAPLDAKAEAVATLGHLGVDVPSAVRETLAAAETFVASPTTEGLERVLALPDSWKRPALDAWLDAGADQVDLLARLAEAEPELEDRIVDRLGESGSPDAVEVLERIEEVADRKRTKRVRRALHRLRAAGVDTQGDGPDDETEVFSFAIEADPREARAWSSGVDGTGGRIVWLLAPSSRGGEELLEAVIDDTAGLRRAETMSVTRKGFRSHLERLRTNPAILVVQLPTGDAVRAVREAEARAVGAGRELPSDYRRWRESTGERLLEITEDAPTADEATPETPAAGPDRDLLREAVGLLKDPLFANWAVLGEAAEEAALGVRRAETSDLVVDDEQRKQQVDEAIARAAGALDASARARYRDRLELMADLLERARREDEARLARAAAVGFTQVDDLYASHPFARAMVQRGVLAAYQGVREREAGDSESPIARP